MCCELHHVASVISPYKRLKILIRKKSNAFIYGSGSIASRHSCILSQFGFNPICISARLIAPDELFHKNAFSKIQNTFDKSELSDDDIFVIASSSHLHSSLTKKLITSGISAGRIFCEKPGPHESLGVQILYNLEYLELPGNLGAPISFVHCADAKKWPSDLDWSERYIFRQQLGGGVWLTHSHELVRCFGEKKPCSIKVQRHLDYVDIDGGSVCVEAEAEIDTVAFHLSLVYKEPLRYWQYENGIVHFYGQLPDLFRDHDIYHISVETIEKSYYNMWHTLLFSTQRKEHSDLSWVHALP